MVRKLVFLLTFNLLLIINNISYRWVLSYLLNRPFTYDSILILLLLSWRWILAFNSNWVTHWNWSLLVQAITTQIWFSKSLIKDLAVSPTHWIRPTLELWWLTHNFLKARSSAITLKLLYSIWEIHELRYVDYLTLWWLTQFLFLS